MPNLRLVRSRSASRRGACLHQLVVSVLVRRCKVDHNRPSDQVDGGDAIVSDVLKIRSIVIFRLTIFRKCFDYA